MRPGFTLTEVLIASALLTVAMGATAFLMASAFGAYRTQDRQLEMNHLVHDRLESLTATSYRTLGEHLQRARDPDHPNREHLPAEVDFVKAGKGSAAARFDLVPPGEPGGAYTVKRRSSLPYLTFVSGRKPSDLVSVAVRLEYWDPLLDRPVSDDRGLIRADVTLKWQGRRDHGVVYRAR